MRLADRGVNLAEAQRHDPRFRARHLARLVEAFRGFDFRHRLSALAHRHHGVDFGVVRARARRDFLNGDLVGADVVIGCGRHGDDGLDAPARGRETQQRQSHAGMGDRRAIRRKRQAEEPREGPFRARRKFAQGADDEIDRDPRRNDREKRRAVPGAVEGRREEADCEGRAKPGKRRAKVAALPGEHLADRHQKRKRQSDRDQHRVEERRADGDLLARDRLQRERIKRADDDRRAAGGQQQIIHNERAFARDRREQAADGERSGAQRKERQRAADEEDEDRKNKDAAIGIAGESVDGSEHARAHEEGAEKREREGENGEKDRPDFQRLALFHHRRAVKKRRAGDPRHERGVLDRVPEPESAPAERVIGPVGAHGDAERQRDPGEERPGPRGARPGGVDAPADERGGREGEDDREADIADIEQRRMNREARVLQDRVEIAPFPWRLRDARKGIGGDKDEEEKRRAEQALHSERVGAQPVRDRRGKKRDQRAAEREHEHPKEHRAFVIPPDARDFVDEGFERMRVLDHIDEREIRDDMRISERAVGKRDEEELRDGGGTRDAHQGGVVHARAGERDHELHQRQRERENERVMSGFDDHGLPSARRSRGRNSLPSTGRVEWRSHSGWGDVDGGRAPHPVAFSDRPPRRGEVCVRRARLTSSLPARRPAPSVCRRRPWAYSARHAWRARCPP